jgi:hypothetical protein
MPREFGSSNIPDSSSFPDEDLYDSDPEAWLAKHRPDYSPAKRAQKAREMDDTEAIQRIARGLVDRVRAANAKDVN